MKSQEGLGNFIIASMIKIAIENKCIFYDLGFGFEEYKTRWSCNNEICQYELFNWRNGTNEELDLSKDLIPIKTIQLAKEKGLEAI